MYSCGIQAMGQVATLLEIRKMDEAAEMNSGGAGTGAHQRYFGQAFSYLRPLERVCGTESDIDAMRSSLSSADSIDKTARTCVGLGMLIAIWLACVL